ncbi:MAG: amidophosphoribosyltransferase [Chloroherpetonaceae bacterium]|nr:amidophosphoribosyltransferase [Chloroherpetonaceae bacterium]MCS7210638.1 amidophosphoribosyltransferase [Chloroherpetonaceae bacterium]MDW8020690.1 amidophosphoribosyltransferase [Chloroherpetonaceae bacterium]
MCGIFGIYNSPAAAIDTFYGLYALQHRGQEGAGIVVADFDSERKRPVFRMHKGFGLVSEVFRDAHIFDTLKGRAAIGHNRYSTTGSAKTAQNIQPFAVNYKGGHLALAHNGNLTNHRPLRKKLSEDGVIFQATSDTEVILHLIARSKADTTLERIYDALMQVQGAYSLVILTDDALIAARDPLGFRPLSLGIKKPQDKKDKPAYLLASETCAFDLIGAKYEREILPGEILMIDQQTLETGEFKIMHLPTSARKARCIFEFVYFARPDSVVFGESVDKVRRKLGKNLSHEGGLQPEADEKYVTVISVPDSSNTAALGFVTESNKHGSPARLEIGLIRNHYVGRTFIQPGDADRQFKVRTKFNIVRGILKNRRVVVVDDSIVRGTTSKLLVQLLREAHPKEIHLRISSPPITHPCFYGMDFPTRDKLIAYQLNGDVEKIRQELGVDSLVYLSLKGMLQSVPKYDNEQGSYCTACFSGNYPVPIDEATTEKEENDE